MHSSTRAGSRPTGGLRRLRRLVSLLAGGIVIQAAAGGCQESLSSVADALGQPLVTGIGSGLTNLVEALLLSVLV
jgi:hypothetical protein